MAAAACSAFYPELSSPVRPLPNGEQVAVPPPTSLRYIVFKSAEIPDRTRDGRRWDRYGGSAPDPFARLLVDDRELILTPVQSDTLTPTWPDQKRANYELPKHAKITVELWDKNPISNHPICVKVIKNLDEEVLDETLDIQCESGARLSLTVAPAHAVLGLGLYYELRTNDLAVTRVVSHSPVARAGIRAGDKILRIQGRDVRNMEEGEAQSLINANARTGLALALEHENGSPLTVTVKEGPMYPTLADGVPLNR